jgi:hypothetical protein
VNQDRPGADADRILVAQLTGEARHRARWRPLTGDEEAAALAELRSLAAGRADLLAQVAGIFEGASEGEPDEPLARSAARLCRMAGADAAAIPAWIEEGRRRSANAQRPPFSGGLPLCSLAHWHRGGLPRWLALRAYVMESARMSAASASARMRRMWRQASSLRGRAGAAGPPLV